jgi:hypothetical protein
MVFIFERSNYNDTHLIPCCMQLVSTDSMAKKTFNPYIHRSGVPIPNRRSNFSAALKQRARDALRTRRTIVDNRAARNAIPTQRLIVEDSNNDLDSFDFDDGILDNADSDEGELERNEDDDVVGVERQPTQQLPIENARQNPSPFQVTNVTHQLIVDDDDDEPMPSLMFRTTEPHNAPPDLPATLPATLPVPLPVDPPEAPIHNLSNGERAKIMLDAREQKNMMACQMPSSRKY